jgi:hypothetical protein
VLWRILGPKEARENFMKSFIICTLNQILLGFFSKEDEMGGTCRMHGRDEKCIFILIGKPEGRRPLGRPKSR